MNIGCGDASFGREALTKGCQTYLGIEGSHKMMTPTSGANEYRFF